MPVLISVLIFCSFLRHCVVNFLVIWGLNTRMIILCLILLLILLSHLAQVVPLVQILQVELLQQILVQMAMISCSHGSVPGTEALMGVSRRICLLHLPDIRLGSRADFLQPTRTAPWVSSPLRPWRVASLIRWPGFPLRHAPTRGIFARPDSLVEPNTKAIASAEGGSSSATDAAPNLDLSAPALVSNSPESSMPIESVALGSSAPLGSTYTSRY